jgi:hypothetical protein
MKNTFKQRLYCLFLLGFIGLQLSVGSTWAAASDDGDGMFADLDGDEGYDSEYSSGEGTSRERRTLGELMANPSIASEIYDGNLPVHKSREPKSLGELAAYCIALQMIENNTLGLEDIAPDIRPQIEDHVVTLIVAGIKANNLWYQFFTSDPAAFMYEDRIITMSNRLYKRVVRQLLGGFYPKKIKNMRKALESSRCPQIGQPFEGPLRKRFVDNNVRPGNIGLMRDNDGYQYVLELGNPDAERQVWVITGFDETEDDDTPLLIFMEKVVWDRLFYLEDGDKLIQ